MNTTARIFSILFCLSLFLTVGSADIFAQVEEADIAAGLENCFIYYDYGKVAVNLATNKPQYIPGETAQIFGTIINENTFPLVDVAVYAQLRRRNTSQAAIEQGHYLLERKIMTQPMNLLPQETRSISAAFPLLSQYPSGSYELQYFIFSPKGFHYAGRPFLEEDYAGKSLFDIQESAAPLVYFDLASVQVNNSPVPIRGPTEEFEEETLRVSAAVIDTRNKKSDIPVTVKYYSFEDTFEENLVTSETVTLSPGTGKIETSFRPPTSGAYVMVMRMETPAISELKYRFAKIGGQKHSLRINDLGITSYPPTSSDKAYVCFHSPAPAATPLTTVTLRILDDVKNIVGQKTVTKEFPGEVLALAVPFATTMQGRDFWVQADARWKNETGDEQTKMSEVHYTCDIFQSSPKDLMVSFQPSSSSLAISAVNSCGETVRTGGYIESIRVRNENGETVKEQYNSQTITQDIIMEDLPAGNYTAEVRSGDFDKEVQFMIAGASSQDADAAKRSRIMIIIIAMMLLLASAAAYYVKRKHKRI